MNRVRRDGKGRKGKGRENGRDTGEDEAFETPKV
jgi:hypothetical protein